MKRSISPAVPCAEAPGRSAGGGERGGTGAGGVDGEAPGGALGGVEVEGGGLVRPGARSDAAGEEELLDAVERRVDRQGLTAFRSPNTGFRRDRVGTVS
jgi:hypothetical protein